MSIWHWFVKPLKHNKVLLVEHYKGVFEGLKLYWKVYGGLSSLITSPYLHLSLIISLIAHPAWMSQNKETFWFDLSLSTLPNLLGFTLGGYAILLAFGDDRFRKQIAEKTDDGNPSLFMSLNGAFLHFIITQAIAILFAIIGNALEIKAGVFAWIGFTLFIYSILTAVAAALAVLDVADLFEILRNKETK